MAARAIGLDVGTNAVRAVEIELGDPPLIRRMGQVGLPIGAVVDGEVADVGAVAIALRELWNQAGFNLAPSQGRHVVGANDRSHDRDAPAVARRVGVDHPPPARRLRSAAS